MASERMALPTTAPAWWTLNARYYPVQLGHTGRYPERRTPAAHGMGDASSDCACRSKWWLLAAALLGGGLAYALKNDKKKRARRKTG